MYPNLNVFHEIRATMWQLMDNKDRFSFQTSCSYTQDVGSSNPASPTRYKISIIQREQGLLR